MTTAEELIARYTRLARDFDETVSRHWWADFHLLGNEEGSRLLQVCMGETSMSSLTMALVGLCHDFGKGTPRDPTMAREWFERSAQLGDPVGMYCLADWYDTRRARGDDVPTPELILQWFTRSAELGYPPAMSRIGTCYRFGQVAPQDDDLALRWYHRAVCHGVESARLPVTLILCDRETDDKFAGVAFHADSHLDATDPKTETVSRDWLSRYLGTPPLCTDVALRWRQAERKVTRLNAEVEALRTQNDELRTEIEYRPGGPGYTEAQADFERLKQEDPKLPQNVA